MKNVCLLTKAFFKNSFATSKKSGNQLNGIISLLIIGCLFGVASGVGTYFYYRTIGQNLPKETILLICFIALSIITVMFTFFQMHITFFNAPDYNLLASLPLKNSAIVTSKFLSIYLSNLLIDFFTLIPPMIIYLVNGGGVPNFFFSLVSILFTSLIPLLFVTVIAALVSVITANSKHSDLLSVIIYAIFFLAFGVGIALIPLAGNNDFLKNISKSLPYYTFLEQAFKGQYLSFLWFVLINLGALVVVILLISVLYGPLNQMKRKKNIVAYKASGDEKSLSLKRILFKKEMHLVTKNPTFLLSSYFTPFLAIAIGIITFGLISKGFFEHNVENAIRTIRSSNILVNLAVASLATTTYASFSMEGKNFPLLFVYPVDKKKIIQAKIKAGIIPLAILFAIATALEVLFVGIFQGFGNITYTMWINAILLPVLGSVTTTLIGAIFGMMWPRFDFTDPNDVLKKSKAMFVTMIVSLVINMVAFTGYIFALQYFASDRKPVHDLIVTGITSGFYIIVIASLSIYLHKNGEKMFSRALEKF